MREHVIAGTAILCAFSATASENLRPARSPLAGEITINYTDVISVLADAYTRDVLARAVVIGSRSPEYAVGIKSDSGTYRIFHAQPAEVSKDLSRLEVLAPKDFRDLKVDRCQVGIEPELARRLVRLWEAMLLRTRFPMEPRIGFDGATYHFSMPHNFQNLAGNVWSPPPKSNTGLLVGITETMVSMCTSGDRKLGPKLAKQVDALFERLKD